MDDIGRKLDDSNANDQDDQAQKIIDWVSPLSFRQKHLAILESVQQGTGGWLIQHETFQRWAEGNVGLLWCPGIREATDFSTMIHTLISVYSWSWQDETSVSNFKALLFSIVMIANVSG